jgi:hypothetical protein
LGRQVGQGLPDRGGADHGIWVVQGLASLDGLDPVSAGPEPVEDQGDFAGFSPAIPDWVGRQVEQQVVRQSTDVKEQRDAVRWAAVVPEDEEHLAKEGG